jgi:hypothetical protein
MAEPFLGEIKPAEFRKVRTALEKKGVSSIGVTEFLAGRPVSNSADRMKLAAILVAHEKASPVSRR